MSSYHSKRTPKEEPAEDAIHYAEDYVEIIVTDESDLDGHRIRAYCIYDRGDFEVQEAVVLEKGRSFDEPLDPEDLSGEAEEQLLTALLAQAHAEALNEDPENQ